MVTGAGRGIGAATSLLLARQGCDLFLNYRADQSSVDAICDQIRELRQQVVSFPADISEESQVEGMFEVLDQGYSQLDVLVNNAGVLFTQMRLADTSAERINTTLKKMSQELCCAVEKLFHE